MRNRILASLCALALATLAGCATVHHQAVFPNAKPVSFSPSLDRDTILQNTFSESDRQVYFFFQLIPLARANGIAMAQRHLGEGDGIVNLTITTNYTLLDYAITLVTGGLLTTWHIEARGDVVMIPGATTQPPSVPLPAPPR